MAASGSKNQGKESDTAAIGSFLSLLWSQRTTTFAALIAGLFAALAYLLFNAFVDSGISNYRRAIILSANGTAPGTYPNGTKFAPSDLRAGGIVAKVHKDLNLAQFGLSLADLDSALSVLPYSPALEQINLKFGALLAQPAITLSERAKIEQDYQAAVEQNNSFGAVVSLSLPSRFGVPPEVAQAVLAAILNEAASVNVNQLGVASAAGARDSAKLVDEESLASLDVPLALHILEAAQDDLLARTRRMLATPGVADIAIGPDQLRLNDIWRGAERLGATSIRLHLAPVANAGIVRDKVDTMRTLASLIREDQIRVETIQKSISQIDNLIVQSDMVRSPAATPESGGTSAQLSDTTVSRLVDLAVENADIDYRRSLFTEKKALGEQVNRLFGIIEKRRLVISAIEQQSATPTPDTNELIERFATSSAIVAATQNRLWGELNALSELASGPDGNAQKQIFEDVPLRDAFVTSGGLGDRNIWLRALLILASFIAGGALLQLGRTAIRPQA